MQIDFAKLFVVAMLCGTFLGAGVARGAPSGALVIETDGDGAKRLEAHAVAPGGPQSDVTVTVSPSQTLQRWDGVGAALTDSAEPYSPLCPPRRAPRCSGACSIRGRAASTSCA